MSFLLVKTIPGDPAVLMLGPTATPEAIASLRTKMGLDEPVLVQFWIYLKALLHGDLGTSWQTTQPVLDDLILRFPATLELVTLGLLVAILIGLPLGLASASTPRGRWPRVADFYGLLAGAVPDFWLALVLVYVFYTCSGIAPAPLGRMDLVVLPPPPVTGMYTIDALLAGDLEAFRSALSHLVLPVLTLGIINAGPILKMTQSTVEKMLQSDFSRYEVLCGHAARARRAPRAAQRAALGHHHHQRALRLSDRRCGAGRDRLQLGRGRPVCRPGRAQLGPLPGARLRRCSRRSSRSSSISWST